MLGKSSTWSHIGFSQVEFRGGSSRNLDVSSWSEEASAAQEEGEQGQGEEVEAQEGRGGGSRGVRVVLTQCGELKKGRLV